MKNVIMKQDKALIESLRLERDQWKRVAESLQPKSDEMRNALIGWKTYFERVGSDEIGNTTEETGEFFTDCWFKMERALDKKSTS